MTVLSSHVAHSPHTPDEVFAFWARPETWPEWDADVREVRFEGTALAGSEGWMRPASGPATIFKVAVVENDHVFTNTSALPGARLLFEHVVVPKNGGARISVQIRLEGRLARIWSILLRRTFDGAAERNVLGLERHLHAIANQEKV